MFENFMDNIRLGFDDSEDDDMEEGVDNSKSVVEYPRGKDRKRQTSNQREQSPLDIMIVSPRSVEDAKEIIDHLMGGSSVTINLETTRDRERQRIMDMISGYCYGHDCNIEKVNENIFVVSHMDIVQQ